MKEEINYIDKLIVEKVNNHIVQPVTDWETFNTKFTTVMSSIHIGKKQVKTINYFTAKTILVSVIILSIFWTGILLIGNKHNQNQESFKAKERISLELKVKQPAENKIIETKDKTLKNKNVIIRKEIIIRDTLYKRNTVIIKE